MNHKERLVKDRTTTDRKFMEMALRLAAYGHGKTNPNPMVAALIVKNGKVVGKGYHKRAGKDHAEIIAIRQAGRFCRGATLYVNLEPCPHFGKTPPCTDTIIRAGIRRVVISMLDPNPINNGRSVKILRRHNIKVDIGLFEKEAKRLNEVFIKYITKRIPFITIKIAQSLDGKIATRTGESKWITDEPARRYAHRLRSEADAILVGVNTVIKDDPLLTARGFSKNPVKIILDPNLKTPLNSRIFSKDVSASTIIATGSHTPTNRLSRYAKKAKILLVRSKNKMFDLASLLKELAKLEISHILVEGGGNTIASFIEEGFGDKVLFFIAPKIIGGKDAPTSVEGMGVNRLDKTVRVRDIDIRRIGKDILVEGYIK